MTKNPFFHSVFSFIFAPAAVPLLASDRAKEYVGRCELNRAMGPLGGDTPAGADPAQQSY